MGHCIISSRDTDYYLARNIDTEAYPQRGIIGLKVHHMNYYIVNTEFMARPVKLVFTAVAQIGWSLFKVDIL